MKISYFILFTVLLIQIATMSVSAAAVTVSVGSVTGSKGDTVHVPITIANNPGIADAVIWFDIPPGLKLIDFDGTNGMDIDTFFSSAHEKMVFLHGHMQTGYTGSLLVTLVIKIEESAVNKTNTVSIITARSSFSNINAQSVPVTYAAGSVMVTDIPVGITTSADYNRVGSNLNVFAAIKNDTVVTQKFTLIFALYKDNKLNDIIYKSGNIPSESSETFDVEFFGVDDGLIRILTWDDLSTMSPLSEIVELEPV